MKTRHVLSQRHYFLGSLLVAVVYGINQFPTFANAATNQLLAKLDRQDLTEAVFIGIGLLICLLGLFGLDCFRARHPRAKKDESDEGLTESTSAQQ